MIGTQVTLISDDEWDKLVQDTYKRPYCFQQQDGCKERGLYEFSVSKEAYGWVDEYENDTVPEESNHEEMGVSFKAWLERSPEQKITADYNYDTCWHTKVWWERNFYPSLDMIIADLFERCILPEGEYAININW